MSTPSPVQESSIQIDALAWLEINKHRILTGVVLVSILIVALLIYRWRSDRRETSASHALFDALKSGAGPATAADVGSAPLLNLAQSFEGTRGAERALLLGATQLYIEGNYAEARQRF